MLFDQAYQNIEWKYGSHPEVLSDIFWFKSLGKLKSIWVVLEHIALFGVVWFKGHFGNCKPNKQIFSPEIFEITITILQLL